MDVIKQLLGSKKAIASVVTVVVNLVIGFLPADTLDMNGKQGLIAAITSIAAAYLIGQGVADHGKGAKQMDAADAKAKDAAALAAAAPDPQ